MVESSPVADTYEDTKGIVYDIVFKFWRKYGGELEELQSIGNEAFMDAYKAFDPSRGNSFSTLLHFVVKHRLMDNFWTGRRRRMSSLDNVGADGKTFASQVRDHRTVKPFNLSDFASEMSNDAQTVLQLIVESPQEIADLVVERGNMPRNWRSTVRQYLRKQLKWTADRVAESFDEIRGVLVT